VGAQGGLDAGADVFEGQVVVVGAEGLFDLDANLFDAQEDERDREGERDGPPPEVG
jgi:hypothetical protein